MKGIIPHTTLRLYTKRRSQRVKYNGMKTIIYRITAVLKVKTNIITTIAASPTGRSMIMYVEIFKNDVIVFIGDVKICLTSHWPINSHYIHSVLVHDFVSGQASCVNQSCDAISSRNRDTAFCARRNGVFFPFIQQCYVCTVFCFTFQWYDVMTN